MTLGERIKYVRENLYDEQGTQMTQRVLANLTGLSPGHHGVGGWETRGTEPRERARLVLSALTDQTYRPGLFARREAEVLVKELVGLRLARLEVQAEAALKTVDLIVSALEDHGIEIPDEAA